MTFYACYMKHCGLMGPPFGLLPLSPPSDDANPISFQVFSDLRSREHIGLLSGTAFESPVWIEFETCRRRLLELALELEQAEDEEKVPSYSFPESNCYVGRIGAGEDGRGGRHGAAE